MKSLVASQHSIRNLLLVVALALTQWMGSASAFGRDPVGTEGQVGYAPRTEIAEGLLPFTYTYTLQVTSPANHPEGRTSNVSFLTTANSTPVGVDPLVSAGFVSYTPSQVTFDGPEQTRSVQVRVAVASTIVGSYGYQITTVGWVSGFKFTQVGASINATVSLPPVSGGGGSGSGGPPAVSISTPTHNKVFTFAAGTVFPVEIPLGYRVTAPANSPISSSDANLGGIGLSISDSGRGTSQVDGTAVMSIAAPGDYSVQARGSNAYGTASMTHDFKVVLETAERPVLTVTADNKSKTYGDDNPTLTATITGFLSGDTRANSVEGEPAIETAAGKSSSVGSYTITAALGGLTSTKYRFQFVNGTLTVNPKELTSTTVVTKVFDGTTSAPAPSATNTTLSAPLASDAGAVSLNYTGASATFADAAVGANKPLTVTGLSLTGSKASNYTLKSSGTGTITANSTCTAVNFVFDGNTAASGTTGNIRTYTVNGVSVKVSAFSRVRPSPGGALAPAYLGVFPGGLGVTDTSEGSGSGNLHTVDNIGRDNFVLFEFSQPVVLKRAYLGYVVNDSDMTVWVGNANDPFNNHLTLSDSLLNGFAREDNDTTSANSRLAEINAAQRSGNVVVIAASLSDTSPDDEFKIGSLEVCAAPVTVPPVTPPPAVVTASGLVFFDINTNGSRNSDEPSLAGITVKLYKKSGSSSQYISQTTTNAAGVYSFPVTSGTTYEVDVVEPAGMTATTADERVFTASSVNVTVPDVGLGLYFRGLANLTGDGKSHGYWKSNIGKANDNKTSGVQETKADIQAYTNTISGLMLSPFTGLNPSDAEDILNGSDQLKLQLLASEYNFVSGRLINDSIPLTYAFIYWGEYVSKNASSYSSSYRTFVKDWMDAFNNSYGGRVAGPIP